MDKCNSQLKANAPALWNPIIIAFFGAVFTPIFGAVLISKNWLTLEQPKRSSRALYWSWAAGAYVLSAILLSVVDRQNPLLAQGMSGWILLLVFWTGGCFAQQDYIKKHYGSNYPQKPWAPVITSGFASAALVTGLLLAAAPNLRKVKSAAPKTASNAAVAPAVMKNLETAPADREIIEVMMRIAEGEEGYFVDIEDYVSCVNEECFETLKISDLWNHEIEVSVEATSTSFVIRGYHRQSDGEELVWDSSNGGLQR